MNYDALFNSIAAEPSSNKKIEMLKEHKDDALLKEIVRLTLDPFTNFYIRKIPRYHTTFGTMSLSGAVDSLKDLSNRVYTGNAAIDWLTNILQHLHSFDAKVIECIIDRDLACGVSVGIANKVWPGLISKYPVMLCSTRTDKLVNAIPFPAIVQTKADGMRFNAVISNGGGIVIYSKTGKAIDLHGCLDSDFLEMGMGKSVVYDGELLVKDTNGLILDRKTGNGILNKAVKGTITLEEASRVVAVVWDRIPYSDFLKEYCRTPYKDRLGRLSGEVYGNHFIDRVGVITSFSAVDLDDVQELFHSILEQGGEGVILKDANAVWENKRSQSQIKFKAELDCDLLCIGIEEGRGKYTGMIGGLVCQSRDGILNVVVGSGLTDEMRNQDPAIFLDKIIAVKYNARSENKAGDQTLSHPVFLEVRLDKDEADSSEVIK